MHVLITGASGFVGRAVRHHLVALGHRVTPLPRRRPVDGGPWWDPAADSITLGGLAPVDAVLHLAGESIAAGRWAPAVMARIRDSRCRGTALLSAAVARLEPRPVVLISASAIGLYGDRMDEILTESSAPGQGFLAEVCRDWEAATAPAAAAGIRVVTPRLGVVLGRGGGALARMLTPFRLGLGGVLGSGRQYMSWVALSDVTAILERVLREDTWHGAVNVVAPDAVTNREFTRALAHVLRRPAVLPAPAWALRLLFGEMADAALLSSARVSPARLLAAGYLFEHPALEPALRTLLR